MIYVRAESTEPIRQGDIFRGVPRVEVALDCLPVVEDGEVIESSWEAVLADGSTEPITALVALKPVDAIVITQDCDAVRSPTAALCEICAFHDVEGRAKQATAPKAWVSIVTQHARVNQKWFYLPTDEAIGFHARMGVDFRRVIQVPRLQLEAMIPTRRIGRLNETATAHFRERLGEFFRRYAYDEWYPLTQEELEAYRRDKGGSVEAFPWQR